MIPSAISYFSGIGGMELGLSQAGIEIKQSLELDKKCCDSLRLNFSHRIVQSDIKNILALEQPESDILVGTYPCDKYSSIADIHGTRTGDELFLHFFRQVALKQPEMYVIENVPGMKKFPVVMEAMTKLPDYYINEICPIDTNYWLPQNRARLIIIGSKKPWDFQLPVNSKRKLLKDIIEPGTFDREIPKCVYSRLNGMYRDKPIIVDPSDDTSIAPTCVAHYAKDLGTRLVKDKAYPKGVRPFTVREYARLQGFPDTWKFTGSELNHYRQIGNAVAVDMSRYIGQQIMKYFS